MALYLTTFRLCTISLRSLFVFDPFQMSQTLSLYIRPRPFPSTSGPDSFPLHQAQTLSLYIRPRPFPSTSGPDPFPLHQAQTLSLYIRPRPFPSTSGPDPFPLHQAQTLSLYIRPRPFPSTSGPDPFPLHQAQTLSLYIRPRPFPSTSGPDPFPLHQGTHSSSWPHAQTAFRDLHTQGKTASLGSSGVVSITSCDLKKETDKLHFFTMTKRPVPHCCPNNTFDPWWVTCCLHTV